MEQVIDLNVFSPLIDDHKTRFNGAYAHLQYAALSGKDTVFFTSGLYDPECWEYKISHNDPMMVHIRIEKVGDDSYVATFVNGSLTIYPLPEDKYMAYSSIKHTFRKTKGDAKKIIAAIIKWQEKRLALVKEWKAEIPHIESSNLKDI